MDESVAVNIPEVNSGAELLELLRNIDITVPGRTCGRKGYHTERWMICRLLATLAESGRLVFPLSLSHRSRLKGIKGGPDFFLYEPGVRIGLEATEAIPESLGEANSMLEGIPDGLLDMGLFRPDAPKLNKGELQTHIRNKKLTSPGWGGDQVEREWAQLMQRTIDAKLAKLRKPLFERSQVEWLSVYDNLPQAALDLSEAMKCLLQLLQERPTDADCFDRVFIEHGRTIVEMTPHGLEFLPLEDLWCDYSS